MKAMNSALNTNSISIKRKLMTIIIFICAFTLLLSASLISFYQLREYKDSLVENMSSVAKITAENLQAAVMFNNSTDANNILAEFKTDKRILTAAIYSSDKKLLFSYNPNDRYLPESYDVEGEDESHKFEDDVLDTYQSITIEDDSNIIGYLYLTSSLNSIYQQLKRNIIVISLIMIIVFTLAIFITLRLQKIISNPILALSKITNRIKNEKDYSIRVEHDDYREIEELSDGFNSMLEEIQNRDQHLQHLATYDVLTSLHNRNYFIDLLEQAIARGNRKSQRHAILFMDLDRFKNINDSLGHSVGDELLIQVAKRLGMIIRGDDIVARFGGDEFTFLLRDLSSSHQAAEVADRILGVLNEPFDIHNHKVVIVPSIGIVFFPENGLTPDDLLKNADTAMYRAKNSGGNKYLFFTDSMNEEAQLRQELEEALRDAIVSHQFILHYQPKIDLNTGKVVGMEALSRWNRNGSGLVAPNIFIPIAEETGLIIPMGLQVLKQAIQQTKTLIDETSFDSKVAVNISAKQFGQKDLLDQINLILEECELSSENLELELTEAVVMENSDIAIKTLNKIRDAGISLAMDDFGTGYSSLSYLKKFPINTLKIDMSFIRDMEQSDENKSIVKTIIDLAHILKLDVVAEGIESQHQAVILREMGCDIAQGYLYSKPIDFEQMSEYLKIKR
jgi:diguanylate cyclase (GGDEF)-like protein